MKFYTTNGLFKFTWDQVTCAFWSRYPNPYSTHVVAEDTVSRRIVNGCLISHRIIMKTSSLPKWTRRFMPAGSNKVYVLEESIVDPKAKTLTTYTRNLGLTKYMLVEEKCTYTPTEDNNSWTNCCRQAWISSNLFGLSSAMQSLGLERFKKSVVKTFHGYEHVLNKMYLPEEVADIEVTRFHKGTEKLKESKEKFKESAMKAKESAKDMKELAKSKTQSVVHAKSETLAGKV